MDREKKLQLMSRVAAALNEADLLWAVGGSAMLFLRGIADKFRDIDLLIAEEDFDAAAGLLRAMGKELPTERNPRFPSRRFGVFEIDGIEVDLIAGFSIVENDGTTHRCPLQIEEVDACVDIFDQAVALHSLGAWYQYYIWMGRPERQKMIDDFLQSQVQ